MCVKCIGCGECCEKRWIVKLTNDHEKELFKEHIVFGTYIWTHKCPYLKDKKCTIQEEKPLKCKEYYCEKHFE